MASDSEKNVYERFRQTFFDECEDLLQKTNEAMERIQSGSYDSEALHEIFRAVHSIKAGAGALELVVLVEFSHDFEALLDLIRNGEIAVTPDCLTTLLKGADTLSDLIAIAQEGSEPSDGAHEAVLAEIRMAMKQEKRPAGKAPAVASSDENGSLAQGPVRTYTITFRPSRDIFRHANEPLIMFGALRQLGNLKIRVEAEDLPPFADLDPESCYLIWHMELTGACTEDDIEDVFEFVLDMAEIEIQEVGEPEQSLPSDPATPAPQASPSGASANRTPAKTVESGSSGSNPKQVRVSTIRVDLERVDCLVNMVGELVIAQSMVLQNVADQAASQGVSHLQGLEDLALRMRELQEGVMAIRMQPVKTIFTRMPRVVRDISARVGKEVRLATHGEETEVDKTVIEELSDPLMHMIRNAIDHGLEGPQERVAAGKPREGRIELSAEHRSGRIWICVADDGRGIDRPRVLARAIDRGLVPEGTELSDREIDQLLFAPGFSTAETVSDISGRGVGMDVVRRNIQALGGRVSVESTPDKGSKFILTLPLTLAVLDGMMIRLGSTSYILPLNSILETVHPTPGQLRSLPERGDVLSLRGEFIPLANLGHIFGENQVETWQEDQLIVICELEAGSKIGLIVDDLLGQQQVVIKSIDQNYGAVPGVAAATILGDGRVALIVDIEGVTNIPGPSTPDQMSMGDVA